MGGKIVKFYSKDAAKDPDAVLEQCIGKYQNVLVLGWTQDGEFSPRADLNLKPNEMLWLMELFKQNLLSGVYDAEDD
jgi:hypothetical protein